LNHANDERDEQTSPRECREDGRGRHLLLERLRAAAENEKNSMINALLQ